MIRKPSETDFRESATVTAIRETKRVAVEGGKGAGEGLSWIAKYWLITVFGIGFLSSVVSTNPLQLLIFAPVVLFFYAKARTRRRGRIDRAASGAPDRVAAASMRPVQAATLRFDRGAIAQSVLKRLVPGLLALWLSHLVLKAPLSAAGIALFALAFLAAYRMMGEQVALSYDAQSITANGLLGKSRMMWADVEDVSIRKFSIFNLPVLFSAGTRRCLVIEAPHSRLDGPTRLLVPIDWLGLDEEGQVALIAALIACRAAGGAEVPSWQPRPAAEINAERFDPDAIMARALAERARVIETARPDLADRMIPRHFGRKSAR